MATNIHHAWVMITTFDNLKQWEVYKTRKLLEHFLSLFQAEADPGRFEVVRNKVEESLGWMVETDRRVDTKPSGDYKNVEGRFEYPNG